MNVEEALRDAMAAEVAGVHASPSLAQSVRRRSRRHTVRFRTAGAALLTAAVATGVPLALTTRPDALPYAGSTAGSTAGTDARTGTGTDAATGSGDTAAVPGKTIPDVLGRSAEEVMAILEDAGYTARVTKVVTDEAPVGTVYAQAPPPGTAAPAGSAVTVTIATTIATTARPTPAVSPGYSEAVPLGQDLERFAGVRIGYLPRGLEWGNWSGVDGFGKGSATTSWVEPGLEPGMYSVQMIVYRKESAAQLAKRMRSYAAQGADPVDIGGRKAYLVRVSEAVDQLSDDGTRTIVWTLASGVGVEVMISPDYAAKLGRAAADEELRKIAAGVSLGG